MAVRTIKHGVLKIKDSAASAVTVNLAQGTLRYQIKNKPSSLVLDRGTADQWMLVDDVPLEFSFEVAVTNILGSTTSGFSNLTLAEALGMGAPNNNSVTLSATSDSPAGEPTTFNLELVITDPNVSGSPSTETFTWSEAICDVLELVEGYPTMLNVSGKAISLAIT